MPITVVRLPPAAVTVDYVELDGSPKESIGENGFEATRELICPWDDRLTLAVQLSGDATAGAGAVTYTAAQRYPRNPAASVASVAIAPFGGKCLPEGGDTKVAKYDYALLTTRYSIVDFDSESGGDTEAFVSESLEPTAEFITLPGGIYKWGNTSGPWLTDEESPGFLVRGCDWVYTRHKMPFIPPATLSLVGYVNNAAIFSFSLGLTFAKETLLYQPPTLRRQRTASGVGAWELTYRFSYRPGTWNKFFRASSVAFEPIWNDELGQVVKVYPLGDFLDLIG